MTNPNRSKVLNAVQTSIKSNGYYRNDMIAKQLGIPKREVSKMLTYLRCDNGHDFTRYRMNR
jgi:Mn-dependent DtxR family transcriptional regulator